MDIEEQIKVLENDKKNQLVSASAGSGKTFVMIKLITKLICECNVPVSKLLVLTFTKAAAEQMKERLLENLKKENPTPFVIEQIDALSTSNISTIHAFCEKYLKKYANLLDLSENFEIVDGNMSQKIREDAFKRAYKKFEEENYDDFQELASSFKNNKEQINDVIFEVEKLVNSVANKKKFLEQNLFNADQFFEKSVDYLFKNTKIVLSRNLQDVEKFHIEDFRFSLENSLSAIMNSASIYEMIEEMLKFSFPGLPKKKDVGEEVVEQLGNIKKRINDCIDKIKQLNLTDKENIETQKSGKLEKILINFFKLYEKEEDEIKRRQNLLDFYDLEKSMKILSEEENLFNGIEYVFVDEYQDTNKIQERIIKNVAKNCNFVAVGDVKQGIYGFRLASSEIFLKDLKEFNEDDNSVVNYLKFNFRSRQKVLDFVNEIFKVCMVEDLTGVDYEKTSMSNSREVTNFVDEDAKPVNIDIIEPAEAEAEEKTKIYSVKNAKIVENVQNKRLLKDIKRRILEVRESKISDKGGVMRKVKYSDIAILSRSRNSFFEELEIYLQDSGIPVVSNSRNKLMTQPEMKMLLSYLKLALCFDDDVACLSVLISGLYQIDIEKIFEIKNNFDGTLCEAVKAEKSGIFDKFKQNLQEFCENYQIFGIKHCLEQLFSKTQYRAYLNLYHNNLNVFVDTFLNEVKKYDFDLPGLINYFETVEIVVDAEVSEVEDAVLLTTIHDSKGLEYPIVFLINCDKSLKKNNNSKPPVEINETFGLALKIYDDEENKEMLSARMLAIMEQEAQKDYVEELMIFYVALTRAQNRLYLFGNKTESCFNKPNLSSCGCYFDFIFYALKNVAKAVQNTGTYEDENLSISVIDDVEEVEFGIHQNLENMKTNPLNTEKIEKYLNFTYDFNEKLNYTLKESVTALNSQSMEAPLEKFNTDSINFGGKSVEVGNAYHSALKCLDFEKIQDLKTLEKEIQNNQGFFDESLVDKNTLLKNILLLKQITEGGKLFKEKEFIMKERLCDVLDTNLQDEILIQGIIDLFVIKKDKIILIDYKYSNLKENYLIEKYKNQLELYKKSLINAFATEKIDVYLLSLKYSNLIKIEEN